MNEQIIELVKENNHISRKEMAERLGCSISTIKRALANLKEEKNLVYEGSSKKGQWIIK
ncbi:MAG: HTH domain-containing protein [Lachnospiraceae bacterium]|nr:HTH domain-containing protein [Lachnospiraceae bacterium]